MPKHVYPTRVLPPRRVPTPAVFELFRGRYATELPTTAVAHFDLFGTLANGPLDSDALRAMGLLEVDPQGRPEASPLAREHQSLPVGAKRH